MICWLQLAIFSVLGSTIMTRRHFAFALFAVALQTATGFATDEIIASHKASLMKVPPGFVVEWVAAPPQVQHPVMACFDDRGRLFVAETAGENLRADDLLQKLPNRILMLEDTKGT